MVVIHTFYIPPCYVLNLTLILLLFIIRVVIHTLYMFSDTYYNNPLRYAYCFVYVYCFESLKNVLSDVSVFYENFI